METKRGVDTPGPWLDLLKAAKAIYEAEKWWDDGTGEPVRRMERLNAAIQKAENWLER